MGIWHACVTFAGSQESEGTGNGCAQARGNHRVWSEWPQGSVRHVGWQAVLLWWWAYNSKYDEPVWWVREELALQTHFFMLVLACVLQLDIVAFASLGQIYFIDKEVQYSLRDYMQESCPNLVGHVNRMKEMYVTHIRLHKIRKCLFTFEPYMRCSVHSPHPPLPTLCGLLATLLVSETI